MLRVVTSLVLLLIIGVVFFILPESAFIVAVVAFCSVGVYELSKMYKFDLINQIGILSIFILLTFSLCFIHYDTSQIVRVASVLLWCFIIPFILILQPKTFSKPIISILGIAVFATAVYSAVLLHVLLGAWQLLSIMAIAWVADIGAYFVGRKFGRHKLAPTISPGKSIEGAVAGLILVIIYLLILKIFNLSMYLYSYDAVFKFGIILVASSIVGDLFESWLKRVAGVKDSGKLLPGHGGVFDRIDSLVAVLAVSFAMIRGLF